MAEQIIVLDEQKMLTNINDFPTQLEQSWAALWVKDLSLDVSSINHILICGMGGSGIAGLLTKELARDNGKLPITVWADYGLPGWVNDKTLVIACSYSGETEETLDALRVAIERKAVILGISSGGKLTELGKIHNFPVVPITYQSSPRAAIGWLYGTLLTALTKLQLIDLTEKAYFDALTELKATIAKKIFPEKAEELAISLNNKVPLVFAHAPLTALSKRWVNQLNENSKTFGLSAEVPELCHNVIVGTEYAIPEKIVILYLESRYGFSRNLAREKVLHKWFDAQQISFVPLSVKSSSLLSEQWLLIHFGDLLSYYLAGVYGVDPSPIPPIKFLKEALAKL